MENITKFGHKELLLKIIQVRQQKEIEENLIEVQFLDLKESLNLQTLVKQSIVNLVTDKNVQTNLAKAAVTFGSDFIIEKVLGSNKSIKGFLGSMIIEKFSGNFLNTIISKFRKQP